jgi:predicted metallo-beta-lactamase superfamily hydrolase
MKTIIINQDMATIIDKGPTMVVLKVPPQYWLQFRKMQ